MTGEQAGDVLALLVAAFPDAALDNESSSFWVSEIARLSDYDAALEAARITARESRKFPSLAEFRGTYRSRAEYRRPLELEPGPSGPRLLPAEAKAFLERAFVKDMADPPPKLPPVKDGKCDDCPNVGERVAYGPKLQLCGSCARLRVKVAAKLAGVS